jgi:hypothetical protein
VYIASSFKKKKLLAGNTFKFDLSLQNVKTICRCYESVKKKVKLSLCFTNEALRHEDVWGSGCIDPHFLDLGTSLRWVVSFTPLPLYPRERAPGTHFKGGWVDPRAGLDDMHKWKFFTLPGLKLSCPLVIQPIASRYTDWAILAHIKNLWQFKLSDNHSYLPTIVKKSPSDTCFPVEWPKLHP